MPRRRNPPLWDVYWKDFATASRVATDFYEDTGCVARIRRVREGYGVYAPRDCPRPGGRRRRIKPPKS
jgi:hypothetical protein